MSEERPGVHARRLAEAEGFVWRGLLHESDRKGTATVLVETPQGASAVFKCMLPGVAHATERDFSVERDFYASEGFALAPKPMASRDRWFAREHVAGIEVRTWVASNAYDRSVLLDLVVAVIRALGECRVPETVPSASSDQAAEACLNRVRNLLTSGPVRTKRSWLTELMARKGTTWGVPAVRRYLRGVYQSWRERGVAYASSFGHNDLHGDNVLVGPEGKPVVIDYERVTRPGYWQVDVLYFVATVYATLTSASDRDELIQRALETLSSIEPGMEPELRPLSRLFAAAALSNSRFRRGAWLDGELLKSWGRLVR